MECLHTAPDSVCGTALYAERGGVVAQVLWGEGMAGALYVNDFTTIAKEAGFSDPRALQQWAIPINDTHIQVRTMHALCKTMHPLQGG